VIARRELLIGGACVAAGAAAYELQPRRQVSLQGPVKLEVSVPRTLGDWTSHDVTDLIAPKVEGSLIDQLYNESVGRVYQQSSTGLEIMMLLAHGNTQNNQLQLHRPEVCYPSFGYRIFRSTAMQLPLAGGVLLPARKIEAISPDRQENIIYWSRLGEYMPTDGAQQRLDRLTTAMRGYVADGLLARFSILGTDTPMAFSIVGRFISDLVRAVPSGARVGLIGTPRALQMAAAGI
jgi:EpsI family protein